MRFHLQISTPTHTIERAGKCKEQQIQQQKIVNAIWQLTIIAIVKAFNTSRVQKRCTQRDRKRSKATEEGKRGGALGMDSPLFSEWRCPGHRACSVSCVPCPVTHLPFFACQRALVLGCWQFSDSAYLHQICTVIVGGHYVPTLCPRSVLLSFHLPLLPLLLLLLFMSFARTRPRPHTFCQLCICANNLASNNNVWQCSLWTGRWIYSRLGIFVSWLPDCCLFASSYIEPNKNYSCWVAAVEPGKWVVWISHGLNPSTSAFWRVKAGPKITLKLS